VKLVFGLGNPGRGFLNTRHNLGSIILNELARRAKIKLRINKTLEALVGRGKIKERDVILAIPLKFMNVCGQVIKETLEYFHIDLKDLLIISDDMDLERGKMRFRLKGSDGGHRGLRSIIKTLETEDFNRLKLGIGRPPEGLASSDYVLEKFSKSELKELKNSVEKAITFVENWLERN